jgi:hypothetical protein
MGIAEPGSRFRSNPVSCIPSRPGMLRSVTTTDGRTRSKAARAVRPSAAHSTSAPGNDRPSTLAIAADDFAPPRLVGPRLEREVEVRRGGPVAFHPLLKRLPFDELHREARKRAVLPSRVDRDDVRMTHSRHRPRWWVGHARGSCSAPVALPGDRRVRVQDLHRGARIHRLEGARRETTVSMCPSTRVASSS